MAVPKTGVLTTKLSLGDRLRMLAILPTEGGIATVRLVRELRDRFSVQKEEAEKIGLKEANGLLTWQEGSDKPKEFSFSGFELELIISRLRKLDKDEKLTPDLIPLWDTFTSGKSGNGNEP